MIDYYKNFNWKTADKLIVQSLKEDIGNGDITSDLLIPKNNVSGANLLLKEDSIIAGLNIFRKVFELIDNNISIKIKSKDGKFYRNGKILAFIQGNTLNLLKGERVSLNILQRMSGIANTTYLLKKRLNNNSIKITDTRKTTPNFRIFEKLAVRIGGGENHRMGLYDMVLIKDNHINANGGIGKTLEILKQKKIKKHVKVEIEVKDLKEFDIVQKNGKGLVDIVMLDNFRKDDIIKALRLNRNSFVIEFSGGINYNNIINFSKIKGIDYISSGGLTHSYKSTDIALNFII
jgi:nicotinate-nucleotide pyrophosphorylase (carboxylating)